MCPVHILAGIARWKYKWITGPLLDLALMPLTRQLQRILEKLLSDGSPEAM